MGSHLLLDITWQGSPHYEEARIGRVFNHRRPCRYPLAVVKARSEEDIVAAVQLAKEKECRISIRSGGHSWAAWSVRDNAILLDLGDLREIDLEPITGVVRASPSTTGRALNKHLAAHGLMFAGGHCPDVGLGGFLLQGGMGWNCRGWGWACEKVLAVDVVTADGQVFHCDSHQNSDLYWASRGGGPGFPAIVTRFHLQTRNRPIVVRSSGYVYPLSMYKVAFDWILAITPGYEEQTEIVAVSLYPSGIEQRCVMVLLVTFQDSVDKAKGALQLAEDTHPPGTITEWFDREDSLEKQYINQSLANPAGHRYCSDNAYIKNGDDVAAVLQDAFCTPPSKKTQCIWFAMHPCSRKPLQEMALSMQTDHYFALYAVWESEEDDQMCQSWARNIMRNVEKHSEGAYLGDADFQTRGARFWGQQQGKHLMEVRRTWDREGRICGYLDLNDESGIKGLPNAHEWD
ncbi:MAG: hypothetical protein Q9227_001274 [Pyrenula ochraceoflavens]